MITVEKPVVLKPRRRVTPSRRRRSRRESGAGARRGQAHARKSARGGGGGALRRSRGAVQPRARDGLERGSALTGLAEVAFQRGQYPEAVRAGASRGRVGRRRARRRWCSATATSSSASTTRRSRSIARCCKRTPGIAKRAPTSRRPKKEKAVNREISEIREDRKFPFCSRRSPCESHLGSVSDGSRPIVVSASPLGIHNIVPSA